MTDVERQPTTGEETAETAAPPPAPPPRRKVSRWPMWVLGLVIMIDHLGTAHNCASVI